MYKRPANGSSRGYSLVELALVVALLALLAALLMPLLKQCRSQANKTKCMSNMRQLGKAFQSYVQDWGGRWPCPGGLRGDRSYWAQSGYGGIAPYVQSYGGLKTIWCCPELTEWYGIYPPRSYSMNSYMRDPVDWEWIDACGYILGIKITAGVLDNMILVPNRTILLYEGIPETSITYVVGGKGEYIDHIDRCGNWTQVKGWFKSNAPKLHSLGSTKPWHGRCNNYIYCDGHAASFPPHKYPNTPARDCTNEWYVQKYRNVPRGKAQW